MEKGETNIATQARKKSGFAISIPSNMPPERDRQAAGKNNSKQSHHTSNAEDLARSQDGFRAGRSTIDAILRVRELTEEVTNQGGVVLAVSFDIVNAFNTLRWNRIREALVHHKIFLQLRKVIGSYLSQREIDFSGGGEGETSRRGVNRGFRQGSVLEQFL